MSRIITRSRAALAVALTTAAVVAGTATAEPADAAVPGHSAMTWCLLGGGSTIECWWWATWQK